MLPLQLTPVAKTDSVDVIIDPSLPLGSAANVGQQSLIRFHNDGLQFSWSPTLNIFVLSS
jgi:hypothetical protein